MVTAAQLRRFRGIDAALGTHCIAADHRHLFQNHHFAPKVVERNGCGKSSLIKAILQTAEEKPDEKLEKKGVLETASGLVISYINQDTSFLKGTVKEFCRARKLEESLFLALLRKLDMNREQFGKNMEEYSEGQKKKVLIAASLMTPAHLYIWDEPLNYIDVFSRMQIEKLITTYEPTMLLVEHDVRFREEIATKVLEIYRQTV